MPDVWYDKNGVKHTGPRPGAKDPGKGERNEGTLLPVEEKPTYEKIEGEPTRDQFKTDDEWLTALNAYRAAKQKGAKAKSQAEALENR